VHHALGLLLIRTGQKSEAMPALKRAWELQPDNPRYGYVYGIALNSFGEREKAIAILEDVSHRHPNDHQILFTLITLYRDQGNRTVALQYANRLMSLSPQDPAVQQLFQQLQGTEEQ
jgi:Flp pilus assembly protein TadD